MENQENGHLGLLSESKRHEGGYMKVDGWSFSYECTTFYLLKKHICPVCNNLLERKRHEKIVHSQSEEAKDYDFFNGESYMYGNIKFVTFYFECSKCASTYKIRELKKLEKQKKRNERLNKKLNKKLRKH